MPQELESPRYRWQAVKALLRVPLFYKILIANSVVVLIVATGAATFGAKLIEGTSAHSALQLALGLATLGILLTVTVNALVLRAALRPLRMLQATAAQVEAGDIDARASRSPLADRDLTRLVDTFNRMLDSQQHTEERLRALASHALNAAEEERKRISRELHDGVAQILAALLVRIRVARSTTGEAHRDLILNGIAQELSLAMIELRSIAEGLRPAALDMLGLIPALESQIRHVARTTDVEIELVEHIERVRLAPEAELALYRIAQESLFNAVRHANARHVRVCMDSHGESLRIVVCDDGIGFNLAYALAAGRGFGLLGMRERARQVGGSVNVTSVPGQGTTVDVVVPGAHRAPPIACMAGAPTG